MANWVFVNGYVAFNSTALSGVREITLSHEVEAVDDTVMGQNTRSSLPGLKNWSASLKFAQDVDAAAIDSILYNLQSTRFSVEFRATTQAVSTQNPKWSSYAMIGTYDIFSGAVGSLSESSVSIVPAKSSTGGSATCDLTRATA